MKEKNILFIIPVLVLFLFMWGCDPSNPGSPFVNQPPETRITVAPNADSTADHYMAPSSMFHIQWFGHDKDGQVEGYWIQVDDGMEAWTISGDSSIAFESSIPDTANPGRTLPAEHTITVTAQDNEDLRDPTPATRTFSSINAIPQISSFEADFLDGATVGQGISFDIEWEDENPSGVQLRILIDGNPVTEWDSRTSFQFMNFVNSEPDPELLELELLDSAVVYMIATSELAAGEHDLNVEIRDLGGAIGETYVRHITVSDTFVPTLQTIQSTYGSTESHPDGSIFFRRNTVTNFTMIGDASVYAGIIHSYRYRVRSQAIPDTPADSSWSEWSEWEDWGPAEFSNDDLDIGEYHFQAQNRDWAGVESEISNYILTIVDSDFSQMNLLIVDETRDGNGRVGSPDDQQCDEFYRDILEYDTLSMMTLSGWNVTEIDYKTHQFNESSYLSAKDVYQQRLIIWLADDKGQVLLGDNIRILSEYLDEGGRLILIGWDIMNPFTAVDTASFSGFANRYLRIEGGLRDSEDTFVEFKGDITLGYPASVKLDPEKISSRWAGMEKTWTFTPRHRTVSLGTWHGNESATEPMKGGIACVRNFNDVNPWRTIVIGFPLYFMQNAEASDLLMRAVEDIEG